MNATTMSPTSAPIASVRTRNTCSSRRLRKAIQWRARACHHFCNTVATVCAALDIKKVVISFRTFFRSLLLYVKRLLENCQSLLPKVDDRSARNHKRPSQHHSWRGDMPKEE